MNLAWLALGGMLCSLQLSTGSFPRPLRQEEEQHYLELAASGDLEARNILIERNLRLVAHIMKKYYAAESEQEDLISIGTIGLIKAVSTYRLDKNIKFATYAARCIENATLSPGTLRRQEWRIIGAVLRTDSGYFCTGKMSKILHGMRENLVDLRCVADVH